MKLDDPVTIVSEGFAVSYKGVVSAAGEIVFEVMANGHRYLRRTESEGRTWIRGHHDERAPEVLAMRAARAL